MKMCKKDFLALRPDAQEKFAALNDENPDKGIYNLFAWLGWLQEILLDVITVENPKK